MASLPEVVVAFLSGLVFGHCLALIGGFVVKTVVKTGGIAEPMPFIVLARARTINLHMVMKGDLNYPRCFLSSGIAVLIEVTSRQPTASK